MKLYVLVFIWTHAFISFEYIPQEQNCWVIWLRVQFFEKLLDYPTVAVPSYIPTSNMQGFQFPIYLDPYLLFSLLKIKNLIITLVSVKWYLIVVWVCKSLIEAICIFSLENCILKSFAHLEVGLPVFLLLCSKYSFIYTGYTRPFFNE